MEGKKTFEQIHKELMKPIPYRHRVQSANQHGAVIVSYIDSRDVQEVLDRVVGAENWQDKYENINGVIYASIGIFTEKHGWVWKSDSGSESNIEKEKGQASDAFKRAAVKWGIGRFLYSLPMLRLKTAPYGERRFMPVNDKGKILFGDDLQEYCRKLTKAKEKKVIEPGSEGYIKLVNYLAENPGSQDIINKHYEMSEEAYEALMKDAEEQRVHLEEKRTELPVDAVDTIEAATTTEELVKIFNELQDLQANPAFINMLTKRRKEIEKQNKTKKS